MQLVTRPRLLRPPSLGLANLKGPTHTTKQFAQHRLLRKLFDRVWCGLTVCANSLTIFKQLWILLRTNLVVQQFEACVDMFASCCAASPDHNWLSYRSLLLFGMSHSIANKKILAGIYTVISPATGIMESGKWCVSKQQFEGSWLRRTILDSKLSPCSEFCMLSSG